MTDHAKELVSRVTLGIISAGFFAAAGICFRTASRWQAEWVRAHPQVIDRASEMTGSRYPFIAGIVLLFPAMFCLAGALLSSDRLLALFGVGDTTLHSENRSWLSDLLSWMQWL